MVKQDKVERQMTPAQIEAAKRILDRTDTEKMQEDAERSYRNFVESVNKAKDSEIEQALLLR